MQGLQEAGQVADFLGRFKVSQREGDELLVESSTALYLSKRVQLQGGSGEMDSVLETLEQHLTLSPIHLLTLLHYDVENNHEKTSHTVRTLYQYARLTLQEEIINRRQNSLHFSQQQLWAILYSLTRSLQYLEKLGIGYGVLGCDKIFIDGRIKLLDPSAVAEDPLTIHSQRLYSPELLQRQANVDILRSDVFVLGLCVLQAGLLEGMAGQGCEEMRLAAHLQQMQARYAGEMLGLLRQMLQYSPEDRPTFSQIRQYLENTLQMNDQCDQYFSPLPPDNEDAPNEPQTCDSSEEVELVDSEEEEEECCLRTSLNQFQRARLRFLDQREPLRELSRIQESDCSSGERESIMKVSVGLGSLPRGSMVRGSTTRESMGNGLERKQTSKCIKEKVVRDIDSLELQVVEVRDHNRQRGTGSCELSNYGHLFTSPKLMEEIHNQLKMIARNRRDLSFKENVYRGNV